MSDYPIPIEALSQHVAIVGKTGSGKTSTEKLCIEQVVAEGYRVCVLDSIKSDWWGITSSASGDRPGLPFKILGGPRGHVPLHSSAGKIIGQLVGSGKLPLSIIDMADFEAGGLQRFFVDFAPALMRAARGVLYLVIEEAHEFAPKERAGIGAENLAIHWAKKLATAGRSKGLRLIVATQRIQSLHNAVLGSCETVIAHRLTTPADQEPVVKWLKANTDRETQERVASSLSSLPTGTGWLCSGEARIFEQVAFPKFKTYDNTATPTGDSAEVAVKTASVDQEELRALIGQAVKEAEANDPKALKAEVAALKRQLAEAKPKGASEDEINRTRQQGFDDGYAAGHGDGYKLGHAEALSAARSGVDRLLGGLQGEAPAVAPKAVPRPTGAAPNSKPRTKPSAPTTSGSTAEFTGPQQRIIASLAFWTGIGHDAPSREQVAAVAGYKPGSGGFNNLLGGLRSAGAIDYPSGGRVSLSLPTEAPMSLGEARDMLLSVMTGPQKKVVFAVQSRRGGTREEIAGESGYSAGSGGFNNLLGSLRTLGVVTYPAKGEVALADWAEELLA